MEQESQFSVDDVAAAILAEHGPMQTMKLQKLVYYAQAWHLVKHGRPLFDNPIEAWSRGPVVEVLYRRHRRQNVVSSWRDGSAQRLSPPAARIVHEVVKSYGPMTGDQLSALTHQEAPWADTRGGLPDSAPSRAVIPLALMRDYYSRQVLAPEEAARQAVANAAIEGLTVSAETQKLLAPLAAGEVSIEAVIRDIEARHGVSAR